MEDLIKFPCKVGDRAYIKTTCENVRKHVDRDTGFTECPFESECKFKKCKNDNERLFGTVVEGIFNSGTGWHYTFSGLDIEVPLSDFGRIAFTTRTEAEGKIKMREKETKEADRLTIQYDEYFVPKDLCTIDRLGGADDCMSCEEYCQASENDCDNCGIQKCFEKLAAYENTGLTPEQIKELQRKATEKRYPILGTGESIPWKVVENHRGQAIKNHHQTIERLAERGGMSWYEMYCVLSEIPCIPQTKINEKEIKQKVLNIIKKEQPEGDWFLCKEGIFDD